MPRPAALKAANVEQGVALTWAGSGPKYRVFRAVGDGTPERLADSDAPQYLDASTGYGIRYRYFVQALAAEQRLSEVSEDETITPVDTFPPAVPAGVSAVPGVGAIELAWERDTDPDFKGYNVYRSTAGGAFDKIASLIEAPTYSDSKIESGRRYRYAVSAVDLLGNESARSELVEVQP